MEDRILTELARRTSTPDRLAQALGTSIEDVNATLAEMANKGWVGLGLAWFGNDPSTGTTVVTLRPAGRAEVERLEALTAESDEPILVTRAELVAELQRRTGWTDEQIGLNPTLRGDRFWFYPSIGGWAPAPPE